MSLHFSFGNEGASLSSAPRPTPEQPFQILVLSDFSGRSSRGVADPLAGRRAHSVTVDDLEDLPKSLGVMIEAAGSSFDIMSTEDFHPTELYRRHAVFGALRDLRARLKNPSTFAAAAAELQAMHGTEAGKPAAPRAPSAAGSSEAPADAAPTSDFEALLGGSTGAAPPKARLDVEQMLRSIVGPYVVPAPDPRLDDLLAALDRATGAHMSAILHDPAWQGVEARWRCLEMLVQRLELGEELGVVMLDVSRDELDADLRLEAESDLYHRVVTRPTETVGGTPFSLVVWLDSFAGTEQDAELAARLASLCAAAGCPVAAGAAPSLLGLDSFAAGNEPGELGGPASEAWSAFVAVPASASLAVVAPRVLARLPYGPNTDPVEGFAYDEGPDCVDDHTAYLWAPGSVLIALAFGEAFSQAGWRLAASGAAEIDDMPVHVRPDGEMQPCAEAWLSDRTADALASRGLCPVLSVQNRGAVRLASIRAINGGSLAARWA